MSFQVTILTPQKRQLLPLSHVALNPHESARPNKCREILSKASMTSTKSNSSLEFSTNGTLLITNL